MLLVYVFNTLIYILTPNQQLTYYIQIVSIVGHIKAQKRRQENWEFHASENSVPKHNAGSIAVCYHTTQVYDNTTQTGDD